MKKHVLEGQIEAIEQRYRLALGFVKEQGMEESFFEYLTAEHRPVSGENCRFVESVMEELDYSDQ